MASGGSGSSQGSTGAFVLCSFIAVVAVIAYFQHNYHLYVYVWKTMRLLELAPFYFVPEWFPIYGKLEIKKAVHFLWNTPAVDVMPITVARFDKRFLPWFAIYPSLLMIYWGVKRLLTSNQISNSYNMEQLLVQFATRYPELKRLISINPKDKPLDFDRNDPESHIWARPMDPVQFATAIPPYGLEKLAKKNLSYKNPIWDGDVGYDENLARLSLESQLGPHYSGIKDFSELEKKIFDQISSRIKVNADAKLAYYKQAAGHVLGIKGMTLNKKNMGVGISKLCDYIKSEIDTDGSSAKNKKPVDKRDYLTDAFINKQILNLKNETLQDILQLILSEEIMSLHANTKVGFIRLFEQARRSGVFAATKLKWVINHDRSLYYCFSSVGRKTPFVEAAGCFAHLLLEKHLGYSIPHPEVTEAVEGLKKALWLNLDLIQ